MNIRFRRRIFILLIMKSFSLLLVCALGVIIFSALIGAINSMNIQILILIIPVLIIICLLVLLVNEIYRLIWIIKNYKTNKQKVIVYLAKKVKYDQAMTQVHSKFHRVSAGLLSKRLYDDALFFLKKMKQNKVK